MRLKETIETPIIKSFSEDGFFILCYDENDTLAPSWYKDLHWCRRPRLVDGTEINMLDEDGFMWKVKRVECGCHQNTLLDILEELNL